MADQSGVGGRIVAFEGNGVTISTQLRLLPTSPQILILPSIQNYLPAEEDFDDQFEAHNYIRKVHDALQARNETAEAFLHVSTATGKRIVFMNGGTPSAQSLCIRAIMRYETDGDAAKAESIFNQLVKDGVSGLEKQGQKMKRDSELTLVVPEEQFDEFQDPITRAMRAADALDRQTANLQPSNDLDLTFVARPRSCSLPLYGYSDNFGDAALFFVFGAQPYEDGDLPLEEAVEDPFLPKTPNFCVRHYDPLPTDEPSYAGFTDLLPPQSPRCIGESYNAVAVQTPKFSEPLTPWTEAFTPRSPDKVVYGEASLLDMRAPTRKTSLRRVRSLDRMFSSSTKKRDLCLPKNLADAEPSEPVRPRPQSCMAVSTATDLSPGRISVIDGPRTIVLRSKRPSVIVAPVPKEKKQKPARKSYVDKGTDALQIKEPQEMFQPVLPFLEDLVVYFKDDLPDLLLDFAIASFKNGNYPVLLDSTAPSEFGDTNNGCPSTPESHTMHELDDLEDISEEPEVVSPSMDMDEYDPFAYVQPARSPSKQKQDIPIVSVVEGPPTPRKTPTPSITEKEDKFHEFNVAANQTAVAIQNSLRSILDIYFPPESQGYHQFHFSLLPELEGMWQPIFREAEPGSPRKDNRRMDQILAIGSQRVVKRDYASAIIGQLEKLGTKSSGLTRSGRLDFRYLLATAMQAFTAQPLISQTSDNPFTNSYLLATLIVPHLETYLALHSEVRYLLLEYPPEHLATILALQKLVGVDLMKVAQIVDASSTELLPFTPIRGMSISHSSDSSSTLSGLAKPVSPSPRSSADVTVLKANFLLTSTASDSEIATFLSTVWKILAGVSDFYAPEEAPKETPKEASSKASSKLQPGSLQSKFTPFPKVPVGLQRPLTPASPKPGAHLSHRPVSPAASSRAPSFTETVKTRKSGKSKHSRNMSRTSRRRPPTGDGASFITYDPAEDSDYDAEERRLMPLFMHKPKLRKGNSRKALKFLGLA